MIRLILTFLLLFSFLFAQDNLRLPVVVVSSGMQEGTAFVVGEGEGQLYLLTAYHVIEEAPEDIELEFRGGQRARAKVFNTYAEMDIAALSCPLPADLDVPLSFAPAKGNLLFDQDIRVLGHPYGERWDIASSSIKDTELLGGRFTISPTGIGPGNSGGPVLNSRYELIGMMQQEGTVKAECRNLKVLMQACRQWNVPVNLLVGIPSDNTPENYSDPWAGEMILINGGTFQMGAAEYSDQKPNHEVSVKGFYLGKFEVTQAQWNALIGRNPSEFSGCDRCPVEKVSWEDTQQFIHKLNQKTGEVYRLPTEAEWEYAAGGGSEGRTNWPGTLTEVDLRSNAWFAANSKSITHPVGEKQANALGLYDIAGNVWEWCQDWYHNSYEEAPVDGSAWENPESNRRVYRGGSWDNGFIYCHVAFRNRASPGNRSRLIGFRLARTP